MEIWKDIPGFEGWYQISNKGRVKSFHTVFGKRLDLTKKETILVNKKNKYLFVVLHKNEVHSRRTIHRLVAQAFCPNPNNLKYVDHLDEDKWNNNPDNLEWVTHSENKKRAHKNMMIRGRHHWNSKFDKAYVQIIREAWIKFGFGSQIHMAKYFGVTRGTINKLINNKYYSSWTG